MKCCFHLRGNQRCPYDALYRVTFIPHEAGRERRLHQEVCGHHLVACVEQRLDQQSIERSTVEVGYAMEGR